MSGERKSEKSETLLPPNTSNTYSSSSDSGVSSSSDNSGQKEDNPKEKGNPRAKSQHEGDNKKSFFRKLSGDRNADFFDDPFFSERAGSKFKKRFANRPRLSEKIFGSKGKGSVFDNDNFADDLRKRIDEERKMFFDGGADSFGSSFGAGGRPTSPVGGGRTGFPFDDLRSGARARFDEFANRHPMFSTMRNQPPAPSWNFDDPFVGHHGFPRDRHGSGSSGAGSGASTASTGEERVIPIQIIREGSPKPQGNRQSPAPASKPVHEASPPPQAMGPQRCNTEPNHPLVNEETRAARAQSAPPVPQNGSEKFVTKVSIDSSDSKPQASQIGGNCSKTPKPEMPSSNNTNTNAGGGRSIPIIIEGRKSTPVHSSSNGSCNNDQGSFKGNQVPKVSRPAERSPTPPSKKPAPPKDPLAQVTAVMDEVKDLEQLVDEYKGNSREDREYLVLDEMLTRCLIKLDVVETEGRDDVRMARKECIRYIQSCISKLESKAALPPQPDESQDGREQGMETGSVDGGDAKGLDTESQGGGSQQLSDADQNSNPSPQKEASKQGVKKSGSTSGGSSQTMDVDESSSQNTVKA